MKLVVWNVKGFNHPEKIKEVRRFVRSKEIVVCGLVEVRFQDANVTKVRKKWGMGWDWLSNGTAIDKARI